MNQKAEETAGRGEVTLLGVRTRLSDRLILMAFMVYILLDVVFLERVAGSRQDILWNLFLMAVYLLVLKGMAFISRRIVLFLLRTASLQLALMALFTGVHKFQLLFSQWNDPAVVSLERSLFGTLPSLFYQRHAMPWFTEILMFSYVFYVAIYPLLAALIFFKWGREHYESYLLILVVTNLLCNLGFIVYPVASPVWWPPTRSLHDIPMKGYLFTRIGEWIRANAHHAGGSIPSPHCAVGTVMAAMAFRYHRLFFYGIIPVIILLYLSTVFCAYHYVTDSVIGIATGVLVAVLFRNYSRRPSLQNHSGSK